jgi:hypothetical protein
MRALIAAVAAAAVLATAAAPARAQRRPSPTPRKPPSARPAPRPAPPPGARRVALAPLATLGAEARSRRTSRIAEQIAAGIAAVPGHTVLGSQEVRRAIKAARRDELGSCDGDAACLAGLGALLAVDSVVYGEIGGLGEAQVVFLEVVDVASRRALRSTTAQFGGRHDAPLEARAAAFRLLAPSRYVGRVALRVDVPGARVFVDGQAVARSPAPPIAVEVGTHALRVTHPEYRDYVRFVDVAFDATVTLDVNMQAFPVVASSIARRHQPVPVDPRPREPTPWYREWYAVAGFGAVVLVGTAVVVGLATGGIDADREETIEE